MRKILLCVLILIVCSGFVGALNFDQFLPREPNAEAGEVILGKPWPTYIKPIKIPVKNKEYELIGYEYKCPKYTDKADKKVSKNTKCKCDAGYKSDNWDVQLILNDPDDLGEACISMFSGSVKKLKNSSYASSEFRSFCNIPGGWYSGKLDPVKKECICSITNLDPAYDYSPGQKSYFGYRCIPTQVYKVDLVNDPDYKYTYEGYDEKRVARCEIAELGCLHNLNTKRLKGVTVQDCRDAFKECVVSSRELIGEDLPTNCDIKRTGDDPSNYGWMIGGQVFPSEKGFRIAEKCGVLYYIDSDNKPVWRISKFRIAGYPEKIEIEAKGKDPEIVDSDWVKITHDDFLFPEIEFENGKSVTLWMSKYPREDYFEINIWDFDSDANIKINGLNEIKFTEANMKIRKSNSVDLRILFPKGGVNTISKQSGFLSFVNFGTIIENYEFSIPKSKKENMVRLDFKKLGKKYVLKEFVITKGSELKTIPYDGNVIIDAKLIALSGRIDMTPKSFDFGKASSPKSFVGNYKGYIFAYKSNGAIFYAVKESEIVRFEELPIPPQRVLINVNSLWGDVPKVIPSIVDKESLVYNKNINLIQKDGSLVELYDAKKADGSSLLANYGVDEKSMKSDSVYSYLLSLGGVENPAGIKGQAKGVGIWQWLGGLGQ